jgi:hypothetical protein
MASFLATQTNLISLPPWSKDFVPRVGRVLLREALKPGKRNGDYTFYDENGNPSRADLYEPQTGNPGSIAQNSMAKSGQAETVVVDLSKGNARNVNDQGVDQIVNDVQSTPDHDISRVIVTRDGQVLRDTGNPGTAAGSGGS